VVNFTLPAQTDNCGVASTNISIPSGSSFPVGTTPVTVVVTDIHGNTATNTFTVTVNDTEPPQITPLANIVQGVDPGHNYAIVNFPTPTVSDNCGVLSVVATPSSGSKFSVGTNTVTIVATDIHGNASSSTFTVTVMGLPHITSQPHNLTIQAGSTATFTVAATGSGLTYQWFKNHTNVLADGGNVSGSATATLTLSNCFGIDRGVYSVAVSNAVSGLVSGNATLTVTDPVIVTQPVGVTNLAGSNVVFSVTAVGSAPLSYQWYLKNRILPGDTGSTLTLNNITALNAGNYKVVVTNIYGKVTSSSAKLVIAPPLNITSQPTNVVAVQGDNVNFSVAVSGQAPFSYQWQLNGTNIPGANSQTLALSSVTVSNAGSYQVLVSDPMQALTSQPATLSVYTSTVPTLSISSSNSVVAVTLAGVPTFTYAIQTSTNLMDWQPAQTNSAPFTFTDTNWYQGNFYRGVYLHR
jgi:hypothetical protein